MKLTTSPRGFLCWITAGLLAPLVPGSGCPGNAGNVTLQLTGSDVSLPMIAAADARIKQENGKAIIVYAYGQRRDNQPMNAPSDTDLWTFDAVALDGASVTAWKMRYDGQWTVQTAPWPPLDVAYVDLVSEIGHNPSSRILTLHVPVDQEGDRKADGSQNPGPLCKADDFTHGRCFPPLVG